MTTFIARAGKLIRDQLDKIRADELAAPALAVAFAAYITRVMLQRLLLGVDTSDEALSTALALRFALGDRPFIDEISAAQTAGLILTPFVWLYVKVVHSTDGIVLFMRTLFLVAKLALAATVFATIKRHLAWPLALVTSLVCVVFVPHATPSLGYNVLGSGFLTACGFIAARRYSASGKPFDLWWAGLCGGLAALAYPPLVLPVMVLGLVLLWMPGEKRLLDFVHYLAGGGLVAVAVTPYLVRAGMGPLRVMVESGMMLAPRTPSRFFDLVLAMWTHSPVSFWVLPAIAIALSGLKTHSKWAVWVLPFVVTSLALAFPSGLGSQHSVVIYAGLYAPAFLVLLWQDSFCRALFFVVWIPSVLAGLVTAYTSTNGEPNAAIGLFPAAMLFLVYQAVAVERLSRDAELSPSMTPMLMLGPAVLVLSLLARFNYAVYRDSPVQDLVVRVETGPYRGLWTTGERANLVRELEQLVRRYENPAGRIFVYWESPAGYLFSSRMQPAANTVWPIPWADQNALLSHYRRRITGKGFVIKVKSSSSATTVLDQYLEQNGRPLETTEHFIVTAEPAR